MQCSRAGSAMAAAKWVLTYPSSLRAAAASTATFVDQINLGITFARAPAQHAALGALRKGVHTPNGVSSPCVASSGVSRFLSTVVPRDGGSGGASDEGDARPPEDDRMRRQRLIKERLQRGGLHDHLHVRDAKVFTATPQAIKVRDATAFPSLQVDPLLPGGHSFDIAGTWGGRVTMVTLSFKSLGHDQLQRWHSLYHQLRATLVRGDLLQLWDVSFVEGFAYRLLKPLLRSGLRRSTPAEMLPHTVTHFANNSEVFCDDARVHNRVIGYAYLVDDHGRVRWQAHHNPLDAEVQAGGTVAAALVDELDHGELR